MPTPPHTTATVAVAADTPTDPRIAQVLTYWLGAARPTDASALPRQALWFGKTDDIDAEIRARFGDLVEEALSGALDGWAGAPLGRLALIVLLDQFTRNIFRGSARSFAGDPQALQLALDGMLAGHDMHPDIPSVARLFCYLPLEHAEDESLQNQSVAAFTRLHDQSTPALRDFFATLLDYAVRHQVVIVRFGRYPHRNALLGRSSTPEELEHLKKPGPGF